MLKLADSNIGVSTLSSFANPCNVAVIGSTGGIGKAFLQVLSNDPAEPNLIAFSRRSSPKEESDWLSSELELENETSIIEAVAFTKKTLGALSAVFVTTGLLHENDYVQPEKSWRSLDAYALEKVLRINTVGPSLVAKHFLPLLKKDSKSVFACLSARVGSIEDNRLGGWYAYRASKAALNMILKTLSIELARSNPNAICVGLHPGTVDTALSKPFQSNVKPDKLFTPEKSATALLSVVNRLQPADTGKCFAWDGEVIPY
jgi:NAD(P)-dependent dehydrogenase (short-subunit alcohol dehydrogenase family)